MRCLIKLGMPIEKLTVQANNMPLTTVGHIPIT